ncbi:MAG: heterodisulfide reductase-related iron-sulfur binding cluster [Gammaproteobacteria bacterium]|nr:heterodisulfide reductase-related iron-sulfur binding cluster [Gammaproteobacteria bacterium]
MATREGSLEAPIRHPLGQNDPDYYNQEKLQAELDRVFNICHGCRRCFNLCAAFPTLFDAVDQTDSLELDEVDKAVYGEVVENCYMCDLCFQTKCPYVPPHEWNIDFPHLMLRAKAIKFNAGKSKFRDRIITSTDMVGSLVSRPVIAPTVNAVNRMGVARKLLDKILGIHAEARLPDYQSKTLEKQLAGRQELAIEIKATQSTRGKVAMFATCYGNYNLPHMGQDLIRIFEHNGIPVHMIENTRCCGMPKYELGDFKKVERLKQHNIPVMVQLVEDGWDLLTLIPSCTLMFKQELPLMFPDDPEVGKVSAAMFDPFEYLMLRHKDGLLRTDFKESLGKVAYHAACHQRVQNIGSKTRDVLQLIPETEVVTIERCSGHDGTYTIKSERHEIAMKICRPVVNKVKQSDADFYTSDCAMAGQHIESGLADGTQVTHPLTLLKQAYGIIA